MMRILLSPLLLRLLAGLGAVQAQELKFRVAEFYQDQQDLTAQEEHRDDGDGRPYAVIKVTSDKEDDDLNQFSFDFNYIKCSKEMRDGELWVFVQRNAKNVTMRREGYKTLKYPLPLTIQAGKTYRMKLSVQARVIRQRILQFKVAPAGEGAIVKVRKEGSEDDFQLWGAVDSQGSIDRLLDTGEYSYEVSAENYKTAIGKVSLAYGSGNHVENITLVPNFGFLEVGDAGGFAGAEVYVNDRKVGQIPYKSKPMECRSDYRLMVSKGELYRTYSSTVEIRQGETTKVSPRLESNFAETTIKVEDGAEIFINGTSRGKGSWTGPLRAGPHNVECRLPSHVPSQRQIVVKPDVAETFVIEKPRPIEGSIYVKSNPSGARVLLDGKELGVTTPHMMEHVPIGSHRVTLMLDNHKQEHVEVNVKQGETATADVTLNENPASSHSRKTSTLARKYQQRSQLYVQPTFQVGAHMGVGAAVGGFLSNVNVEADFLYGLGKETVYWLDPNNHDLVAEESYSNMYFGGKVGWGFVIGSRLRLTPQVGAGLLRVSGSESDCYAVKGTVGVRVDYAVARHFGLVVAPEYHIPFSKSEVYNAVSAVSSAIKGWGTGFNCTVGLNVFF